MNKIEILAPAGGMESLVAAVRSGADAVYVGEKAFSARSSAHNFDAEELTKAVAYCHIHGVRVYVTINTLIFDDEFEKLKEAILIAANADADALIVQNLGVARLAKSLVPDMPLHASTQMSIHTASGVKALYEMGFKRVVLSREMSRDEIIKAAKIPVELEVFVHGALCMSVSGQCYFSAMLGSRSGNRGSCAQTCRLPFRVENKKGECSDTHSMQTAGNYQTSNFREQQNNFLHNNKESYALSLKDNSLVSYIDELEKIGVCSAKIEGRMKRPEYVSVAVRACREQRDLGFVTEKTADMLKNVFSRTGFTDGYYTNKLGQNMFGTRRKDDVISADEKLFSEISLSYKDELQNVEISGKLVAKLGKEPVFEVSDGNYHISKMAEILCEKAVKIPLDKEKCLKQLGKTGGTAYSFKSIEIDIDENISLPLSVLNQLRRDCLASLDAMRSRVNNFKINDIRLPKIVPKTVNGSEQGVRIRTTDTRISSAFKTCEMVFVPLFSDINEIKRLKDEGFNIAVEIPRGMFGREKQIENQLSKVKNLGVADVLCHNLGALHLAKSLDMTMHGGFGLNLVNTYDLLWAEEYGIKDVELSFELTFSRINALGGDIPRGIISYGHLPLMLCRNCPNKSAGIDCKSCKNTSKMTDRKGKSFYLRCDGNCTEVLNCVPVFIASQEISKLSTNFHILRFTVENYVENVEEFKKIEEFIPFSMLKDKFTRGLYKRGVN